MDIYIQSGPDCHSIQISPGAKSEESGPVRKFLGNIELNLKHHCSNVRMKEGSGQGWLVETRVILLLFSINLNRCALCASSVHQLYLPPSPESFSRCRLR